MRVMEIPPFQRTIEIGDPDAFVRTRLSQEIVVWPQQAIPLAGYMCHPDDVTARRRLLTTLQKWSEGLAIEADDLRRIHYEWRFVADVVHTYLDLVAGGHQQRRGGPSIGKAITLVAMKAESWGTGEANLWRDWTKYKDVAHLTTAAVFICYYVRRTAEGRAFGPMGLAFNQLYPFQMVMMMPDLVLALALDIQSRCLASIPGLCATAILDPNVLWRIPIDINVLPLPLPQRALTKRDYTILNDRRAGNRGRKK
jgi:hypothetical protein